MTRVATLPKRPRGRPTPELAASLEQGLLEVALREFVAHGYGGASLSRIVKAAHISKTTLYSRFASKEALFRAIMRDQIERLGAATTLTSSGEAADLASGLVRYANRTLEVSLSGELLSLNRLIYSESHRFPELGIAAAERTELGIAQVAWFIERHTGDGSDAPSGFDARALAEAFIFMLRGWYVDAMLANRIVPEDERKAWVARMVPVLVRGL